MKPLTGPQRRYIAHLRGELGVTTTDLPATAREGKTLIDSLIHRREAKIRAEDRQHAASAQPSDELRQSIEAVASRLGIAVEIPVTEANARFVLDDLYHRERKSRRVADGSVR